MYPDNLHTVNANNASSGLMEKAILTNLVPKYGRKNGHKNLGWGGRRGNPRRIQKEDSKKLLSDLTSLGSS